MNSHNWKSQLKNAIQSVAEAEEYLGIKLPESFLNIEKEYPLFISRYYLDLIDKADPFNDPIWKLCMPAIQETADITSNFDPLAEEEQTPVPRLIHRYEDRVVLLMTNRCPMLCRFCFRKRKWKAGEEWSDITPEEIDAICDYLSADTKIREVLISGGDPLMLSTSKLKTILTRLSSVKNIDVIRLATRIPVTLPARVDNELVAMLEQFPQIWVVTHYNHPQELSKESLESCRKIIKKGIPILNQTVLLKGVNDETDTLEKLFRALVKNRIKPHYLFHVDPVRGVKHFATGIDAGLAILKEFRTRLSSIAVPHFAIDLPGGGGKVALQPDYTTDKGYQSITGKSVEYY